MIFILQLVFRRVIMFSGIVETVGVINDLKLIRDCLKINISPYKIFNDLNIGDSVSVNGVCLTITNIIHDTFDMTIVPETMRLTNLGLLTVGSLVNLERSIQVGDRISGHYVQGHIDATGEIIDKHKDGEEALILKINFPYEFGKYIVKKGYIALDGMSITTIDVTEKWFTVTLIPHTQQVSIANQYSIGTKLNIEVDILGKYVEKLLGVQ